MRRDAESLARRAAGGDLVAARRLVALLEAKAGVRRKAELPPCGGCGQEIVVSWDLNDVRDHLKTECGEVDAGVCCHDMSLGGCEDHDHSAESIALTRASHSYARALVAADPAEVSRLKRLAYEKRERERLADEEHERDRLWREWEA